MNATAYRIDPLHAGRDVVYKEPATESSVNFQSGEADP